MAFLFHFCGMHKISFNGHHVDAAAPLFTVANRGYRYGDGLFETMKLHRGKVLLFPYHLQRMRNGCHALQLDCHAMEENLVEQIEALARMNNCSDMARIRLSVFRADNNDAGYVLEANALTEAAFQWQEEGWRLSLYRQNRKSADELSNMKTANYLLYVLADIFAKAERTDEALVLNTTNNLCDGSRTNLFLVLNGVVKTPALNQGCVAGVMRRYILEQCSALNIQVQETVLTETDLLHADEVFLTNAIEGIRWVKSCAGKTYSNQFSMYLFRKALATIYG